MTKEQLIAGIKNKIAAKKAADPNWQIPQRVLAMKEFQSFGEVEDDTSALNLLQRGVNIPGGLVRTAVAGAGQGVQNILAQQTGQKPLDLFQQEGGFLGAMKEAAKGKAPSTSQILERGGADHGIATTLIGAVGDVASDLPSGAIIPKLASRGLFGFGRGMYRYGMKPLDVASSKYSGAGKYPVSEALQEAAIAKPMRVRTAGKRADLMQEFVGKEGDVISEAFATPGVNLDIQRGLGPYGEAIVAARNIDPVTGQSVIPPGVEKYLNKLERDRQFMIKRGVQVVRPKRPPSTDSSPLSETYHGTPSQYQQRYPELGSGSVNDLLLPEGGGYTVSVPTKKTPKRQETSGPTIYLSEDVSGPYPLGGETTTIPLGEISDETAMGVLYNKGARSKQLARRGKRREEYRNLQKFFKNIEEKERIARDTKDLVPVGGVKDVPRPTWPPQDKNISTRNNNALNEPQTVVDEILHPTPGQGVGPHTAGGESIEMVVDSPVGTTFNTLKKILGSAVPKKAYERLGTETASGLEKAAAGGVRDEALRGLDAIKPGLGAETRARLRRQGGVLNAFKQAGIEIGKESRRKPISAVDAMLAGAHAAKSPEATAALAAKKLHQIIEGGSASIGAGLMKAARSKVKVPESAFIQLLKEDEE